MLLLILTLARYPQAHLSSLYVPMGGSHPQGNVRYKQADASMRRGACRRVRIAVLPWYSRFLEFPAASRGWGKEVCKEVR
jgi:hypothetical protein